MKGGEFLVDVAAYYADKLERFGQSPQGVDWNSEAGQFLRFEQLAKLILEDGFFSINDVGCGYAALYDFLESKFDDFSYCGIDVSKEMLTAARERLSLKNNVQLSLGDGPVQVAEYSVASGIFNVRLGRSDQDWKVYLEATLDALNAGSEKGFAFNCLTSYSDAEKKRDYLYYADPCVLFDFCKRRYSKEVALLHDYSLYEFTILVRK
jgi:SAM-dependent methyltransferase